jgi:hyaluronate lyase
MRSMIKYWAQTDTYRSFTNNVPLQLIAPTEQLMADANTPPRDELLGHWTYAGMDRVVHLRPGWGLGLSMSSSRIYNYESINGENLHGWFQGDGVTYLYTTNDPAQFSGAFWPTVDPYSLPGTTVDKTPLSDAAGQSSLTANSWVGGVTLGANGAAGQDLAPVNTPLAAKKSWFMFDDEVVCLGAGITCSDNADIQTTALNRKLSWSNTNAFTLDGNSIPPTIKTNFSPSATWCALDGFGGCYFPGGAPVHMVRQFRTNSWSNINDGTSTTLTNNAYLTLWFDHGVKPVNATYSYVLLPNFSASQIANYTANPEITILENSANAQAIKDTSLNIVAANFWTDSSRTIDLITVNRKASVMTQEANGMLSVAVADPTQTNATGIAVTLNRAAYNVVSADPAITITQLRPTIQMIVNISGALGRSLTASFSMQNSAPYFTSGPFALTNINAGVTLTATNSALDADNDALSFSLISSPTNATIGPTNGVVNWRPTVAQAGSTNLFSVVVSDSGSPSLSATQSFTVVVNPLNRPLLAQTVLPNRPVSFLVSGSTGPDYSIEASSNLVNWFTVFSTNQPAIPFNWTDPYSTNFPMRCYRIRLSP